RPPTQGLLAALGPGFSTGGSANLTSLLGACACPRHQSSAETRQPRRFRGIFDRSRPVMHAYRTHHCGPLRQAQVRSQARLSGWVHRKRDLGGLLFIDLRDHYGITQCVLTPSNPNFERLERIRVESVITLSGEVLARDAATVNPNLPTGDVELKVADVVVQSE